jgi:hypothetical protein
LSRIAARNARVYIGATTGGAAVPLPFTADVTIDSSTDKIDVTAHGDTNKVFVNGLPNFEASLSGFYDDTSTAATDALWAASRDGLSRKTYIYPTTGDTTKYWFGDLLWDFSASFGVNDAAKVSGKGVAAGTVGRN